MKNTYCVIMAGGIGSRFWPMSRPEFPKQFHDILGTGRTLLQMTFDRFLPICEPEHILVVTNTRYKQLVMEQLPELKEEQILCEPYMRNTAPCIAYANFWIEQRDPEANIIVAPSDHLILKELAFIETIKIALNNTSESNNLITLGIKPSRPDTGYGYIQFLDASPEENPKVRKVKTFTEKPDLSLAEQFIASGDFYWNSGIFIWSLKNIQHAFQAYLPEMYLAFSEGLGKYGTRQEAAFIENTYATCNNISIDYGIMEKADEVNVVLSDFGWSDLGTWGSLHTHLKHDEHGNGVVGKNVMLYDAQDNVVHMPDDKLVVIQGLKDFIVVESKHTLLICKKEDEQKIKQFVNDIKINKGEAFI